MGTAEPSAFFVVASRDMGAELCPFAMESDVRPESLHEFINHHQNIRWNIREMPRLPRPKVQLVDIVEDLPHDDPVEQAVSGANISTINSASATLFWLG